MRHRHTAGFCRPAVVFAYAAALLAASLLSSCVASGTLRYRSDQDVLATPLPATVDLAVISKLVAFAVKDRLCAPVKKHSAAILHRDAMVPIDAVPGPGAYGDCIYDSTVTECDAIVEDLRTLGTLMDRDPRLSAVASFEDTVRHIGEVCSERTAFPTPAAVTQWRNEGLRQCRPEYPALLNRAIAMRWPLFKNESDPRIEEWSHQCADAAWTFLAFHHCPTLERQVRVPDRHRGELPRFVALGIEPYFCVDERKLNLPAG